MNKEELINKIDSFVYDYDPYEYKDTENYPGFNRDQIEQAVRSNDFSYIKDYLKEIIEENDDPDIQNEVKELLKDIGKYHSYKNKER